MAKLHIEGASDRPEAIKYYLDFIDRRDYDSVDAVMDDVYRETGLDIVDTRKMQTTLDKLGIVESGNRQRLSEDLGVPLVEILLYNEQLFFELLHFIYATAYYRSPNPQTAVSWAYYHISDAVRRRAPIDLSTNDMKQEVAEAVMTRSEESEDDALEDPGPLSTTSILNYERFIERLNPSVQDENGEIVLRSFAPYELVLAAVDHLYRTDIDSETREYGNPVELTGETRDILSTILLIKEEQLTDVIEHVASMDARLSIKSDYQLRVRLTDPVNIDDLA